MSALAEVYRLEEWLSGHASPTDIADSGADTAPEVATAPEAETAPSAPSADEAVLGLCDDDLDGDVVAALSHRFRRPTPTDRRRFRC